MGVEGSSSWQMIADRLEAEPSDHRRDLLLRVATHVEAEVRGDIPALMETMIDEPEYHFLGRSGFAGPKGRVETERHYETLVATGMNRLEFDVTRVIVDDDHVITEGTFRHAVSGPMATAMAPSHDHPDVAAGWYLVEYQAIVVWPFDASRRIVGEDIYFGTDPTIIRALASGELAHLGPADRSG